MTHSYSSTGDFCSSDWSCVDFEKIEFNSSDDFVKWVNDFSDKNNNEYDFIGYIYFLG